MLVTSCLSLLPLLLLLKENSEISPLSDSKSVYSKTKLRDIQSVFSFKILNNCFENFRKAGYVGDFIRDICGILSFPDEAVLLIRVFNLILKEEKDHRIT